MFRARANACMASWHGLGIAGIWSNEGNSLGTVSRKWELLGMLNRRDVYSGLSVDGDLKHDEEDESGIRSGRQKGSLLG